MAKVAEVIGAREFLSSNHSVIPDVIIVQVVRVDGMTNFIYVCVAC